jgi:hypothetical protein
MATRPSRDSALVVRAKGEQGVLLEPLRVELRTTDPAGPVRPVVEAAQGVVDCPQIAVDLVEQGGVNGYFGGVGHPQ